MSPRSTTKDDFRERATLVKTRVVAILGVPVVAGVCFSGCAIYKPQGGLVKVTNDLGYKVVVAICEDDHCHHLVDQSTVAPNQGFDQGVSSAADVTNWLAVSRESGRRIGCLRLNFDHQVNGVHMFLSKMEACPQ